MNTLGEFWYCNVCQAQNHETDGECQFCECGGVECKRDNCSAPEHFEHLCEECLVAPHAGKTALGKLCRPCEVRAVSQLDEGARAGLGISGAYEASRPRPHDFGRSRLFPCACGVLTARGDGYCSDACAALRGRDICLPCGFDGRHDRCEGDGCRCLDAAHAAGPA